MRKQYVISIVLVVCFTVLATTASAQSTHQFEIEIPFQFIVMGRTLPAGKYRIQRVDPAKPNVLMLKNRSGSDVRLVITERIESENPITESSLVFQRREGKSYLFQVWTNGDVNGNQLPFSGDKDKSTLQNSNIALVRLRTKKP